MNLKDIPIGNILVLGVLVITGVVVIAAVVGAIFGKPLDPDTRGIVSQFVVALLALFGGQQWGKAQERATQLGTLTRNWQSLTKEP